LLRGAHPLGARRDARIAGIVDHLDHSQASPRRRASPTEVMTGGIIIYISQPGGGSKPTVRKPAAALLRHANP
jgi:hypothetical protein